MSEQRASNPLRKMNSRWRKGAQRYSSDRSMEIRGKNETERVTELVFVERLHAQPGWRNGAKIRKLGN